jgi:alkane 1-monooxygenase
MTRSLPFALAFLIPLLCGLAVMWGGWAYWIPPLFMFGITPVLDAVLGLEKADLEADSAAEKWRDLRYDAWLWAWIPLQLAIQGAALVAAARPTATTADVVGLVFASGLLGGIGINIAHELMHRKGRPERAAAEVLMMSVLYPQFCIEHVLGHHKNIATPADPASARRGQSAWSFVPRSIALGLVSAWRLETRRVRKLGIGRLSLADRRLRYPLVLLVLIGALGLTFGPIGVLFFTGQSAVAVFLLEVINYLEHYGLERREVAPGQYERVQPRHSWNSAHRLTNRYLFQLPRHADHHAHASRPYFALRHIEESPQLPAGYGTMLLVALVPPLWRAVMDPRVDAWRAREAGASLGLDGPARPSGLPGSATVGA